MAFLDEIKNLEAERKWFDLTETIKNNVHSLSESEINSLLTIFTKNMERIHPMSLTSTIIGLYYHISPETACDLIKNAISAIDSISLVQNSYFNEITTLRLYFFIASIKLNNLEDIETQIISLKSQNLSVENINLLYLVGAMFYEKLENYEEAQNCLFCHLKQSESVYDIEKLVELSIKSPTFFDFSAISSLKEFEQMKNLPLKNLFISLMSGDVNQIHTQNVFDILKTVDSDWIETKIYLLNIIRICFKCDQKFVKFDHFINELKIDENKVLGLLLRALGLNIIKGWIDSEERTLFFDYVLPRSLNAEELEKMKMKFVEWRNRVQEIINIVG